MNHTYFNEIAIPDKDFFDAYIKKNILGEVVYVKRRLAKLNLDYDVIYDIPFSLVNRQYQQVVLLKNMYVCEITDKKNTIRFPVFQSIFKQFYSKQIPAPKSIIINDQQFRKRLIRYEEIAISLKKEEN